MRGAHSDVWCSKGQRLIEAELFAAFRRRPAPSGRALLCAANHARKIQGLTASQNLPDARNRAPRTPRFAAHLRCVSAKEGEGSQEGTSTHLIRARRGKEDSGLRPKPYLVSCPLLFPPVNTGISPAAEGGNFSPLPDGGSPRRRRRQFLAGEHRQFPSAVGTAIPGLHLLGNPL